MLPAHSDSFGQHRLCVHLPQAAAAYTRQRRPTPAPPITAIHLSVSAVRSEDGARATVSVELRPLLGAGGSSEDLTQARPCWRSSMQLTAGFQSDWFNDMLSLILCRRQQRGPDRGVPGDAVHRGHLLGHHHHHHHRLRRHHANEHRGARRRHDRHASGWVLVHAHLLRV